MNLRKQSTRAATDYDVVVIGAGHNALVSAAYLAQAGARVGVFERRHMVGGAVSTIEHVPGYQFDLGGSAHILIRLTPIIEELGLERYGLEYLELDPLFFAPFPDGDSLFIYRDLDRTVDHLNSKYPGEGDAYRRFCTDWLPFSRTVRDVFLQAPTPFGIGRSALKGRSTTLPWKQALQMILRPFGEVTRAYFKEPKIRAALDWMASQSGPPPTEPMSGPFLLWHPLYHEGGIGRPKGGSGMLTVALRRHIEAHGGEVHVSTPVVAILTEGKQATGIRVRGVDGARDVTARAVVAGCHAVTTLTHLLPEELRPPEAANLRVGNGFGAILRVALDAPVEYAASPGREARVGLGLICHSTEQILAAYGDSLVGKPASDPPIVAMTFSAVDDTLAPPGGEVLWLWGQYYPYQLASGQRWDDIAEREADTLLDTYDKVAPGTRAKVVGTLFQHPEWLERELGLLRGNVMHLEMSLDQMFCSRPLVGMAGYKTHVPGLYLTGASTHPGGGIMGASGRNAATVVLKALGKRRI